MRATVSHTSKARKLMAMISWPWRVSSATPMTTSREVSFREMMNWLAKGGIMRRKAWGHTTYNMV